MGSATESAVVEVPILHLQSQSKQTSLLASSDETYWRKVTMETMRQMLEFARYTPVARERCMSLHEQLVCPNMGPAPDPKAAAKGCLTSDGTPIEYSLSFGGADEAPVVRYSIDPDGTSQLAAYATRNAQTIESAVQGTSGVDMGWYRTIKASMRLETNESAFGSLVKAAGHTSQIMFGFDFERDGEINAKAYFLPCLAAAERKHTRWQVVREAVEQVVAVTGSSMASVVPQLSMLQEHLRSYGDAIEDSVRYLATDLVQPEKARLKIYIRCPGQEFEQVWGFLTMRGKIAYSEEHRLAIKTLYEATVLLGQARSQDGVGDVVAQTNAFQKQSICYYVLKKDASVPSSKLFIRMDRKTAVSDIKIAQTLQRWLSRSDGGAGYEDFLGSAFCNQDMDGDVTAHAWLAVSVKKGKLTLESYLAPHLFA